MLSKSFRSWQVVAVSSVLLIGFGSLFVASQFSNGEQSANEGPKAPIAVMPTVPVDRLILMGDTPFLTPGLACPEMFSVDEVTIPDDTEIIGIVEGDESKAYVCVAMSAPMSHVINDFLLGIPVSITYCDRTNCARVFSGNESGKLLDLKLGGFMSGKMVVRLNDVMYPQSSDKIPLEDRDFTRAKWSDWKAEFPATKVYVGDKKKEFQRQS